MIWDTRDVFLRCPAKPKWIVLAIMSLVALIVVVVGSVVTWRWWTEDARAHQETHDAANLVAQELKPPGTVVNRAFDPDGLRETVEVGRTFALSDLSLPSGFSAWDGREYEAGPYLTVGFTKGRLPGSAVECVVFVRLPPEARQARQRVFFDIFC